MQLEINDNVERFNSSLRGEISDFQFSPIFYLIIYVYKIYLIRDRNRMEVT